MKILIVMSGGFDTYGPSRHLYHSLIIDLLNSGFDVFLVESHSTGTDPDIPSQFLMYKNFRYEVLPSKFVKKSAFAKRYMNGFKYCISVKKCLKKLSKKFSFDVALMQSCPWAPFMVKSIKHSFDIPLVWNIQDMFPGSSIASNVMRHKWMQKFFYRLQRIAYKMSDAITVISEDMERKVIEQGVDSRKVHVIYNWYDDQTVKEIKWEDNRFVKKYNMDPNIFYVQYAGTMGYVFDYQIVLKIAELLRNDKTIVFQMVGFGSQYELFKNKAGELGLNNIQFLPLQTQDMVSDVYSSCSLCLIPLKKGVIGNSVPSKAGLLMACKRPIITSSDENSFYNFMINENKLGFAFAPSEEIDIANCILSLKNDKAKLHTFGMNGFKYGHKIYSRKYNTSKYINLFLSFKNKNIIS